MSVLFVVVPLAFLLAGGFLAAFLWSVKRGQFDDVEGDAVRVVFDDDTTRVDQGQRSQKSFQTMRATNASAPADATTNKTSGSAG
jgi:cbb3-type cytochrome oxidase maturation protein